MDFIVFSQLCERLEGISGRLEMIDVVSRAIPPLSEEELPIFVRFLMGKIFPDWSPLKVGIGPNLLFEAVAYVAGKKKGEVIDEINRIGDAGIALEHLLSSKEQTSFFSKSLDLVEVFRDFEYLARIEGTRTQREKLKVIRKLFADAQPIEGRYIARLLLGELRIGMGEGNMRDAIARAYQVEAALVEHAHQLTNDLGEVALLAKNGPDALRTVFIEPFRPVKMMLAQQGTIEDMMKNGGEVAAEFKYDGSRFQFHKKGDESRIYSRKLEEVTNALPDIVQHLSQATDHDVIFDGEVLAVRDGRTLPFQYVLRRFRRKHDIDAHVEQIEMIPMVFDLLYLDGRTLLDEPLLVRRELLETTLRAHVAPQVRSGDPQSIESFYRNALDKGHEGIMLKALDSLYTPGVRGRQWVKIKPAVDTMDLAVIGAEWGEGRRARVFGSFLLACQDEGELLPVGKVATGFSDEMLAEIYALLKDSVIAHSGKEVTFEPGTVFEVGYAELQQSPNYRSGFALRFPRFVRLRDDKSVDEIETLEQVKERYKKRITPA
ncbi:MAG: ATP-dependent DNA ligase [Methanomicrobiaceae archaeon]|nr:ATP-dependent DNA ligase [Methanomicrobiaceae archaeon]